MVPIPSILNLVYAYGYQDSWNAVSRCMWLLISDDT